MAKLSGAPSSVLTGRIRRCNKAKKSKKQGKEQGCNTTALTLLYEAYASITRTWQRQ
jgi:hypothetical protein